LASGLLRLVAWQKYIDVSEVFAASIINLIMGTASTSETSVNFYYATRHKKPEASHIHNRCHDNLKSELTYSLIIFSSAAFFNKAKLQTLLTSQFQISYSLSIA
jgi:hypothetical protein